MYARVVPRKSFTITGQAEAQIEEMRELVRCGASDVVEAAVDVFYRLHSLDAAALRNAIEDVVSGRRVVNASSWRASFWTRLAEKLDLHDFIHDARHPYGPRQFRGCQVLFLLPDTPGIEDGTMAIHIFKTAFTGSPTHDMNSVDFLYRTENPVVDAVQAAAEWIAANGDRANGDRQ